MAAHDPENYLTPEKASGMLGMPIADLMAMGRSWDDERKRRGDRDLPTSPETGLRRLRMSAKRYRFHRYDLREYLRNAERLAAGLDLVSWRQPEAGRDPEDCTEGGKS